MGHTSAPDCWWTRRRRTGRPSSTPHRNDGHLLDAETGAPKRGYPGGFRSRRSFYFTPNSLVGNVGSRRSRWMLWLRWVALAALCSSVGCAREDSNHLVIAFRAEGGSVVFQTIRYGTGGGDDLWAIRRGAPRRLDSFDFVSSLAVAGGQAYAIGDDGSSHRLHGYDLSNGAEIEMPRVLVGDAEILAVTSDGSLVALAGGGTGSQAQLVRLISLQDQPDHTLHMGFDVGSFVFEDQAILVARRGKGGCQVKVVEIATEGSGACRVETAVLDNNVGDWWTDALVLAGCDDRVVLALFDQLTPDFVPVSVATDGTVSSGERVTGQNPTFDCDEGGLAVVNPGSQSRVSFFSVPLS